MSGDIKGTIYNPTYYFANTADSTTNNLDLVMLTNGWRRFKWNDLLAGKWPIITKQPEDYIAISGNVYGPSANILKTKEITGL